LIDHVSIAVRDLDDAVRFYEAVLQPLGYAKLDVRPSTVGFGKRYAEFWLNHRPQHVPYKEESGHHVCLRAPSKETVDAFHAVALAAGATCAGAPGMRPRHGDGYYAAFIRDADGNCIEAVTFLQLT
jgi:catechol 2,3-dioxygenase-like lactoylglutathione lyase family enzyme